MSLPSRSPTPFDPTVTRPPAAGPEKAPTYLGRYRLDEPIGAGGMGAVYKAFHLSLKRVVALKILHPRRSGDDHFAARFHREMEAVGRLDHPNVVRATDAGEEDGVLFLVMEYVDGVDLNQLVARLGPLPAADACELIRQAAVGLEYVHKQGLLHRDVKPSNLILSREGVVKILDLGLARLRGDGGDGPELTPSGCPMGTADYLAPEQADDARRVDIRADVYSLGCSLYKLLTGRPPFSGPRYASFAQKIRGHREDPMPPLPDGPNVPAGLDAVLRRMTDKDPARRPSSPLRAAESLAPLAAGSDLSALLSRLRDGGVVSAPPRDMPAVQNPEPPTPSVAAHTTAPGVGTTHGARRRSVRRALPWVVVAAVIASGLAAAWLWRNGGPAPGPHPASRPLDATPADDRPGVVRSLDDCAPLRWYDLLDRPPVVGLWSIEDGLSSWHYDHDLEQLTVNTTRTGLLQLGTIDKENYILRVAVSQASWTGGAGVFLGYHEFAPPDPPQPERKAARYQFLSFRSRTSPQGITFLTLARGAAAVRLDANGKRQVDLTLLMAEDAPSIRREQVVEVTVSGRRMVQVSLNGVSLEKLVKADVNAAFSPDDYRGPVGTVNAASSSVYRNAQFMIHEGL